MKPIALTPVTAAGAAVSTFLGLQASGLAADRAGLAELAQVLACDLTGIMLALYGVGLAAYGLHQVGSAIAEGRAGAHPVRLFENHQAA